MGSVIWDEDSHVVRGAVTSLAGAVEAAICVVAAGVLPTDLTGSYLALIFIWKTVIYFAVKDVQIIHSLIRKLFEIHLIFSNQNVIPTLTEGSPISKKTILAVTDFAGAIWFVITCGVRVAGGTYIQSVDFSQHF